ncbi:MAG: chloride channel protein [Acidithiobacillus sp.]|nr:chloride channel protein [Acidithiobacillus sp.]
MIPIVEGIAGFISGILSHLILKNPGSLGANKAIRAYHENPESLTLGESFTTLFTSAMVLGSGGPSGREGAMSMVGGSVGVYIAKLLKQKPHEVREALAIGVGAGLGAMFKAPLAGAIASSEIFFKHDFDIETIIPAFAASAAAYLVVATKVGFSPLFHIGLLPVHNFELKYLLWFSIFGVFAGLIARLLLWVFYYISALFKKMKRPIYLRAMIGGVLAGFVGLLSSYAIGNGYGWLQLIMDHKISPGLTELALGIGCVILAMSLIAGSGASGGAFSPTVVIGGLSGALFWHFAKAVSPDLNIPIAMFVVVGMMAVFSVAANAPLSTIVMITEMTGSYGVLLPAMLTVGIAMMFGGDHSLFDAQHDHRTVSSRLHI